MSQEKKIGLLIGREQDWPEALMDAVNGRDENIQAELIKLRGTFMDDQCGYDVIIDRISYEIPYYRAFLKFAAFRGTYIINNPFTWSADNKFMGTILINQLGLSTPRTVILPNKNTARHDLTPDDFRNLEYPMDWEGIINYVGVPAIFKNAHTGGRHIVHRVHNTDELIQQYDESGTLTVILQELIESDTHIHCFVIGQQQVLALHYSLDDRRYLPEIMSVDTPLYRHLQEDALQITKAYGYDINMVEFVIKDEQPYVINGTNPTPFMDLTLMTEEQFNWCVQKIANVAIERAKRPLSQRFLLNLEK